MLRDTDHVCLVIYVDSSQSELCSVLVTSAIKYSPTEKESYDFDENKAKLNVLVVDCGFIGKLYFLSFYRRII